MSTLAQIHQAQRVRFQQILIATDFSDASQRALAYALAIARRYDSVLSVVHAIPPEPRDQFHLKLCPRTEPTPTEAEQEMKQIAENARLAALKHRLLLEQGPVWDVLASVIQRESVDLLVLVRADVAD